MFKKLFGWIASIFQREDVQKAIGDAKDKLEDAAADRIKDGANKVKDALDKK